jgi:chromosomal replication initiator protein
MAIASSEHDARQTWSHVVERARAALPESTIAMWFAEVRPATLDDDVLQLLAPSEYVRDRLARNHLGLIRSAASEAAGHPVSVRLEIDEELRATFDAFVPGPSNRFAHAAAMAVAEAPPNKAYNPLFIYGGVGLGKTHLLIAVGHHMYRLNPGVRVKYVTSEQFVTEFIKAVRERLGDAFRQRYREVDVLLVDDIQFLAKREETQTEFFHTFNHLHGAGHQIVIASDRPPHELSGLEDRLVSRFRWGLCVDVQPPDLETRIAILQLKAERDDIHVPPDVVEYVASKFDQSVRELEGALVRVVAWSELTGQQIGIELAERALQDLLPQTENEIPPQLIMEETANYFTLSTADLVSKSRSRPLTQARHIAMYLIRECTGLSLIKIGEVFNRDHTTALHGIKKVEADMRARDATFRQVQDLTRIIRGRVRGAS